MKNVITFQQNLSVQRQRVGSPAKTPTGLPVGILTCAIYFLTLSGSISVQADERLEYQTALKFSYLDTPNFTGKGSSETSSVSASGEQLEARPNRVLGLSQSAFSLKSVADRNHWLKLSFRPDAAVIDRSSVVAGGDWDTRSGVTRSPSREVYLLDQYSIGSELGFSKFELGVNASLFEKEFWRDQLDFGLRVVGPENFFGGKTEWSFGERSPSETANAIEPPFQFSVAVIQGPGQRNERWQRAKKSFDLAPVSSSPHPGLAMAFDYLGSSGISAGFFTAGYSLDLADHRYTNVLVGANFGMQSKSFIWPLSIKLGGRVLQENGVSQVLNPADLLQKHLSLRGEMDVSATRSLLVAADFGNAEVPSLADPAIVTKFTGFQIQVGLRAKVFPAIWLSGFVSHEDREAEAGGSTYGGFNDSNNPKRTIQRALLNVTYATAGSI